MSSIGNIEIYPMISFLIFFIFFLVVLFLVIRSDKNHIAKMAELPLEDSKSNENKIENYEDHL